MFKKIKEFLSPIGYNKGRWRIYFLTEIYDGFQSVFTIQVGVYIIAAIEKQNIADIKFWCIILGGVFLLNYITGRVGEIASEITSGKSRFGLRKKYFEQYIHLDNTKVETIGTGKMQNIIFEGIDNRIDILNSLLPAIIVEIGAIIYAFVLMASKVPNWKYFCGFLLLFVIAGSLMWIGLGVVKKKKRQSKEISLDIVRRDVKILMSKFEILQNNKLSEELDKQWILIKRRILLGRRSITIKLLRQTGSNVIIDGLQIGIYFVVGIGITTGNYTFAYMMLLLQLLNIVSKYIWNIRRYLKDYYTDIVHVEKLQETFASIPPMKIGKNEKDFVYKTGDIQLKNIGFAYDKNQIFKDFSLTIEGGKKTAFVGPSGGGKTTLIKLLAGYIRADKGELSIDNQKISEIKLIDYYNHVGYLTQEPSVFDGTIIENLLYGIDTVGTQYLASEGKNDTIKKIINDAKCEFIREFEKGLETEIGERGIRLSGGQKQRLAIAKIMLKNPNIILLDEPTSALDSFNEELINIALHNLFKGKTVIVVAHRLQTVKTADKIYYIEGGENGAQIMEEGTHAELVKLEGKYKKMLDLQSGF